MLTPKVQDLEQRCRQAERASARLARVAGDLWTPLLEQGMRAEAPEGLELGLGELVASTVLVFEVAGVRWIRDACDAMVQADLGNTRAVEEHRELADRRDATNAALYDLLVEFRERCRAANPGDEKSRLGVSGRTPRRPDLLRRTTGIVLTAVRGWGGQPPDDLTGLVPGPYVLRLERLAGDLGAAVDAAAQAEAGRRAARHARKVAIERCEWSLLYGSRLVESALSFVGREDLAFEIRGCRRPGRPSKKSLRVLAAAGKAANPLFLGRKAVRWAREGFSWLSRAVRRARESFPSRPSLVRRARESFSSLPSLVRRARESFSSRP